MKTTIESIIKNKIKRGLIFDAHTINDYLIQYHNDICLESFNIGMGNKLLS